MDGCLLLVGCLPLWYEDCTGSGRFPDRLAIDAAS